MEDVFVWIFWTAMIVIGIASSVSKALKKAKEAESRTSAADRNATPAGSYTGAGAGSTGADSRQGRKPARKSLAEVLEELAEQGQQRREMPSPTAWPVFGEVSKSTAPAYSTEPAATSHDYYSLETEYDAADGRGYRENYNADDISSYEKLAAERTHRTTYSGTVSAKGMDMANAAARTTGVRTSIAPAETPIAEDDARNRNDNGTLADILGGEFDLRRAVIEAEILTPKYGAGVSAKYF